MYRSLLFALLLILIFPNIASAQVVINEVLLKPEGSDDGAEWVELYNLNSGVQSLASCVLYLDDSYAPQKVVFESEDFIEKIEVISWDASWLNNSGDQIKLECPSFSDTVTYGSITGATIAAPDEGESFGRSPDGSGRYSLLVSLTPNG